ncbi:MAG: ABC transporter permease [Bacteroidia bacterium]|jgi:lipoprotein-releasing system permease protein|nr:ABC transporter permease [Bacteroidia bacterium]
MQLESFIARRLLRTRKSGTSTGVVRLAVVSVAVGLAVMIVAVSVVVGFKQQIRDKVIGFVAHIQVEPLSSNFSYEETPFVPDDKLMTSLKAHPEIQAVQPVAVKPGLVKTQEQIQGVALKGVDENYDWTYLQQYLTDGVTPDFSDSTQMNKVLVSAELARRLQLKTGDVLRMWFVSGDPPTARGRRFEISGIYQTGLAEFDERYVFCNIGHIRRLNSWAEGTTGSLEISLYDINSLSKVADELYYSLPAELTVNTARERFPHIFDWLDLQDMNVVIIIILMVLVSGITIISTLLILILERTATIGMLKAMGAANALVQRVFLALSTRILLRGMLWGNLLAIVLIQLQLHFGLFTLPEESYYLTHVPVFFSLWHIALINAGTLMLWLLSLLIPTRIITRISPARSIRFA